jgi:hypothetical protein
MAEAAKVLVPSERTAERLNDATPEIRAVTFEFIAPFKLVLVRVVRTYLQTLLGLLTAGMAGGAAGIIPFNDFQDLFIKSVTLAIAPAVVSALQNVLEIMAKLDATHPEVRG